VTRISFPTSRVVEPYPREGRGKATTRTSKRPAARGLFGPGNGGEPSGKARTKQARVFTKNLPFNREKIAKFYHI
jgi:hypothetical protein